MEEETTTNATTNDTGVVDSTQPVEGGEAEAVQATEPEHQAEAPTEPSEDEQLAKWAENKGLELDSDNATKAAKMAWNAERAMHQKAQKASELEKTMSTMSDESAEQVAEATGQNPEVLKRLQRMEVKDSVRDFFDQNPEARQFEKEMAKIATESGLYGSPEAILKAAFAIAVSNNQGAVKSQGKREALESLAHKQQAAVPTGNAVNGSAMGSQTITPQNVDQMAASHDQSWFEKNYDAINKAMAG